MDSAFLWLPDADRRIEIPDHGSYVVDARFHPTLEAQVATLTWDGRARLWDMPTSGDTARLTRTLPTVDGPVLALGYSPDGRRLATTHESGTVRSWRLDGAGRVQGSRALIGHDAEAVAVAFDPTSTELTSVSFDGEVRVWPTDHRQMSRRLSGVNARQVKALGFSGDGTRILTRSADGTVRAFTTEGESTNPPVDPPELNATMEHRSGGLRVEAIGQGRVIVADATGRHDSLVLDEHFGPVHVVAASPDGRFVATASSDGSLRLWPMLVPSDLRTRLLALDGPCTEVDDRIHFLGESPTEASEAVAACSEGGRG